MTLLVNEESGESISLPVDWEFFYSVKGNILTLIDLNLGGGENGKEVTYVKE